MKQYFVHYFRDCGNTYNLYYAECPEDFAALPDGAERISRRLAEQLCREENDRRKWEESSSGYADSHIFPSAGDYDADAAYKPGYIVPRNRYTAKH